MVASLSHASFSARTFRENTLELGEMSVRAELRSGISAPEAPPQEQPAAPPERRETTPAEPLPPSPSPPSPAPFAPQPQTPVIPSREDEKCPLPLRR